MKKYLLSVVLSIGICFEGYGQITVTPITNPSTIATLLAGSNITIVNLVVTADTNAIASFTSGSTPLNITSGIILSTGDANSVIGPDNFNCRTTDNDFPGDTDLAAIDSLSAIYTYDAAFIEFDCIPSGDTLYINYGYGSEEYLEYVNTGHSDPCGIFVSGPNVPFQNIALLPNTQTPVNVLTVNPGNNSAYFYDNESGPDWELDGLIGKLTAKVPVIPNSVYHIKIGILDAIDPACDSDLFLESGSISSVSMAGINQPITGQSKIFPVPASDRLNLSFSHLTDPSIQLTIFSATGQVISMQNLTATPTTTLDVSFLEAGLYTLEIVADNKREMKIFIVTR